MAGGASGAEVVLTGTGMPTPDAERAGPGVLVRAEGLALQFDAGRATSMRLAALGVAAWALDAVFITHHHSDHLLGLDDLVMARWVPRHGTRDPLCIVAPEGPSARFARRMLDHWEDDVRVRMEHTDRDDPPTVDVRAFDPPTAPTVVWERGDVRVLALAVRHEPVVPAVAYRVETPAGAVVISGDTRVCAEVESLARGARVLVHEAFRRGAIPPDMPPEMAQRMASALNPVADYHADTVELGAMAQRTGVPTLMLTHLLPPPRTPEQAQAFADDVRRGGYEGEVIVGRDLDRVPLG